MTTDATTARSERRRWTTAQKLKGWGLQHSLEPFSEGVAGSDYGLAFVVVVRANRGLAMLLAPPSLSFCVEC